MKHDTHTLATEAPTLETTLRLLSDPRRRSVVAVLSDRDPPIALPELATAVASRETESESNDHSAETLEAVSTELHHDHLPRLDDVDIIDYDPEASAVTAARTERLTSVVSLLEDAR